MININKSEFNNFLIDYPPYFKYCIIWKEYYGVLKMMKLFKNYYLIGDIFSTIKQNTYEKLGKNTEEIIYFEKSIFLIIDILVDLVTQNEYANMLADILNPNLTLFSNSQGTKLYNRVVEYYIKKK